MPTIHEFDQASIDAAIQAAKTHYDSDKRAKAAQGSLVDDGHLCLAASCISVTVEDGKVCVNLPLGIGSVCLPIPSVIPNGTAAEACLSICTTWGVPTGVHVTVSALGHVVVSKTFGKC